MVITMLDGLCQGEHLGDDQASVMDPFV
jgi:hypothetical protein